MMPKSESTRAIKAFIIETEPLGLQILDQTLLPKTLEFVEVHNSEGGYRVIKDMLVRGAPCIAAVGCLSIILEMNRDRVLLESPRSHLDEWLLKKSAYLVSSRPTAVNLKQALDSLCSLASKSGDLSSREIVSRLTEICLDAITTGELANKRLGHFGAEHLIRGLKSDSKLNILTHCNTGSLATVGYGTALGVIRSLYHMKRLESAYCTETRPYNQGSRLTAWEFVQERMPATLIADNMVAYLMADRKINAVIVGADRVAANGDTANKIGTMQIAVIAKHYGVPFYVASPTQTIDLETKSANDIKIEHRPSEELKYLGDKQLAPDEIDVWNPCFDVTPANLIAGIITEFGVCRPQELVDFMKNQTKTIEEKLSF